MQDPSNEDPEDKSLLQRFMGNGKKEGKDGTKDPWFSRMKSEIMKRVNKIIREGTFLKFF